MNVLKCYKNLLHSQYFSIIHHLVRGARVELSCSISRKINFVLRLVCSLNSIDRDRREIRLFWRGSERGESRGVPGVAGSLFVV